MALLLEKVEEKDKEREIWMKRNNRYEKLNDQLGSLDSSMESMRRARAESSCAIQTKFDALFRNLITIAGRESEKKRKPAEARVDFVDQTQGIIRALAPKNTAKTPNPHSRQGSQERNSTMPYEITTHTMATLNAVKWANT